MNLLVIPVQLSLYRSVGHDNTGKAPGWFLEHAKVSKMGMGKCKVNFGAQKWVVKGSLEHTFSAVEDKHLCFEGTLDPFSYLNVTVFLYEF